MADMYLVSRRPGAPPRRGGRAWPIGQTRAELSPEQVATIAADPRYQIQRDAGDGADGSTVSPAQDGPAPRPKRPRRTKTAEA